VKSRFFLSRWTPWCKGEDRKSRNVKRMASGVRKSLRIDEMDGSISQPEISGFKDKAVGVGRKNTYRYQIAS